jgi:pyruvate/2-oxoacid:ferredoxin oxidoreductase beta subunit
MAKRLALALLLVCSGCGHRLAAQVVLEPSESGSQMSIGVAEKSSAVIKPELPKVSDEDSNRLFAPGRNPF